MTTRVFGSLFQQEWLPFYYVCFASKSEKSWSFLSTWTIFLRICSIKWEDIFYLAFCKFSIYYYKIKIKVIFFFSWIYSKYYICN